MLPQTEVWHHIPTFRKTCDNHTGKWLGFTTSRNFPKLFPISLRIDLKEVFKRLRNNIPVFAWVKREAHHYTTEIIRFLITTHDKNVRITQETPNHQIAIANLTWTPFSQFKRLARGILRTKDFKTPLSISHISKKTRRSALSPKRAKIRRDIAHLTTPLLACRALLGKNACKQEVRQ